eukprot:PLAT5617.1.p1 GENE.PLAT5617.1~~PLAT5617.1.p1  ORF type:complete len:565 (+),score=277.21 PLAT5617.1:52-1746(+)
MNTAIALLLLAAAVCAQRALPSDNFCASNSARYVCASSCREFYFCNGGQKGALQSCPTGKACVEQLGQSEPPCESVSGVPATGPVGGACWVAKRPNDCRRDGVSCNGHGHCHDDGDCMCDLGYTGNMCETPPASGDIQQCDVAAETFILLDGSGSVDDDEYDDARKFSKLFMTTRRMSESAARIGVVQFATSVQRQSALSSDPTAVAMALDRPQLGGETNMVGALDLAFQELTTTGRTSVPGAIILLTDGRQTVRRDGTKCDDNSPECQQLVIDTAAPVKAAGVRLYVLGIGGNIDEQTLKAVASQPTSEHYMRVDNFRDLQAFLGRLLASSCTAITSVTPTRGSRSGGTTLTITGRGFSAPWGNDALRCRFGEIETPATLVNAQTITCRTPPAAAAGTVTVRITLNGAAWTSSPITFTYTDGTVDIGAGDGDDSNANANVAAVVTGPPAVSPTAAYVLLPIALLCCLCPAACLCFGARQDDKLRKQGKTESAVLAVGGGAVVVSRFERFFSESRRKNLKRLLAFGLAIVFVAFVLLILSATPTTTTAAGGEAGAGSDAGAGSA